MKTKNHSNINLLKIEKRRQWYSPNSINEAKMEGCSYPSSQLLSYDLKGKEVPARKKPANWLVLIISLHTSINKY